MISIVVIGRNESSNLKKLYESLSSINIKNEIIYVDSASKDNSVEISRQYCNKVIVLEDSKNLCAAAGRNVGTIYAKYSWIVYLDGDMELDNEFTEFLNSQKFLNYGENIKGFIGYYNYIYDDGRNDENRLLQAKNKIVDHFGGAVMLKKDIVLNAGNWNPSVVANEEFDLYVRIQKLGFYVYGLDIKMVDHIAKKISNYHTLLSLFYPMNRRFFGLGQSLVSQYKFGTLDLFIKKRPFPFLFLIIFLISFFNFEFIFLFLPLCIYISISKKWYYNLIYISEILRGILGIIYFNEFIPKVKIEY